MIVQNRIRKHVICIIKCTVTALIEATPYYFIIVIYIIE